MTPSMDDDRSERLATRPCILVVDDEKAVRDVLSETLSDEGFEIVEARSRRGLFAVLAERDVDLITLDLNLGAEDGLELARDIRALVNVPIIMITGRGEPQDRVTGLEGGADDYITKPFHVREVSIRVRSVLQRYDRLQPEHAAETRPAKSSCIRICDTIFDMRTHVATKTDGSPVNLTETEAGLLAVFLANPDRILSRDDLWDMLRGRERDPMDRTIDGHVARLRSKIECARRSAPLIKSVRGVGYVFIGDLAPEFPSASSIASETA